MTCRLANSYGFIKFMMMKRCRNNNGRRLRFHSCSTTRNRSMSASSSTNPISREDPNIVTLLPAIEDKYGGVIAEMTHPMDPSAFSALLRASLSTWTLQGKKGVWIKLPKQLIGLAETVVKEGFWFHHAERDYLMLVYWIPKVDDTLPANASHRVGIGAFVINHNKEGEYIHDGSVREVKEETGVDTEFVQILAFRQTHKAFFEKSDLFFMCMLKPLSLEINAQETEIEAAQWMPWEEYTKQPFVQNHELLRYMTEICSAKTNGDYEGFNPLRVSAPDQQVTADIWTRTEMVEMAGYGEHKLSSVIITGTLLCDTSPLHLPSIAIPGATVAIKCHTGSKRSSKWIKAVTDELGDFEIDLPSQLHAIPDLQNTCFIKPLYVPKLYRCYHTSTNIHQRIKLVSSTNGFRLYTSGKIRLQGNRSRS